MFYKNVKVHALGRLVVACHGPPCGRLPWATYELLLAALIHALDYLVVALLSLVDKLSYLLDLQYFCFFLWMRKYK